MMRSALPGVRMALAMRGEAATAGRPLQHGGWRRSRRSAGRGCRGRRRRRHDCLTAGQPVGRPGQIGVSATLTRPPSGGWMSLD